MNKNFRFVHYTKEEHSQELLDEKKQMVFSLLIEREKEIAFNPEIIVDYPDAEIFISNPLDYIKKVIKEIKSDNISVVILTTYGKQLYETLTSSGYNYEEIHLNAGPDDTCVFRKDIENQDKTLYIELVNESDAKIRPTSVIHIIDEIGVFCGGICSSVSDDKGENNVYLSTMAVAKGCYNGAGTDLLNYAMNYWSENSISKINLGTQTAEGFYKKNGFYTTKKVLDNLRIRTDSSGSKVFENLVMVEYKINKN